MVAEGDVITYEECARNRILFSELTSLECQHSIVCYPSFRAISPMFHDPESFAIILESPSNGYSLLNALQKNRHGDSLTCDIDRTF